MLDDKPIWGSGYVNGDGVRETPKPYMYFQEYLKLGSGRSISKLHQNCTEIAPVKPISVSQLKRYSAKFFWVKRANAYDNYKQALIRKKNEELSLKITEKANNQIMNKIKVSTVIEYFNPKMVLF